MIINNNKSDVTLVGNIVKNNVGIDSKNLDIITTLLSSNLYSDPLNSFIRETISNAWDAHVEAGTTDKPIILSTDRNEKGDYSVTIRDYGTGVSPERFKEIYCNIGSSTKRDSNDYIGGFGLGRFAALSCSNIVKITSYYNGKAYYYLMIKDNNKISISTLNISDTDEDNGLEVSIDIPSNIWYNIGSAINQVLFVPNLYVKPINDLDYDNDVKIKTFKYFSVSNRNISNKLLIGNILYPINYNKIKYDIIQFNSSNIVFNFKIGELDLTPNRESVIYTEKTIKLIKDRIQSAIDELYELALKKLKPNYNSLVEYSDAISSRQYDPLNNEVSYNRGFYLYDLNKSITYKNKYLSVEEYNAIDSILTHSVPNFLGFVKDNKFKVINQEYGYNNKIKYKNILLVDKNKKLSKDFRRFCCDNYDDYIIAETVTKEELSEFLKFQLVKFPKELKSQVLDDVYNYYLNKSEYLDTTTNKDYLEFIKKSKPIRSKNIIIYDNDLVNGTNSVRFKDIDSVIKYISNIPTLLNFSDNYFLIKIAKSVNYRYIRTSKGNYNRIIRYINNKNNNIILNNININNIITKEEFFKLKEVKILYTVNELYKNQEYKDKEFKLLLSNKDIENYNYIKKYINLTNNYGLLYNFNGFTVEKDKNIIKISKRIEDLYNKYLEVINDYGLFSDYNEKVINLLRSFVLDKLGIFKIKPELKEEISNNKLFKLLKDGKFN